MRNLILYIIFLTAFTSCSTTKEVTDKTTHTDQLNGITKEFYEDGELKVEWKYIDNKLNGISKEYHKDGTYSEWNYQNGQLIEGKSYFKSGKILQEYTFKKGKRDGTAIRYYETGEKETVWEFKNDVLISGIAYYPTGEKLSDFKYKNGIPEGISTEYYKNGKKKIEWSYKDGKLSGESIEYFENGNVKRILNY
jgi:antitoxin component YwqK of YwqJK toxin-antitoxin module